jgi:hypothetical protein
MSHSFARLGAAALTLGMVLMASACMKAPVVPPWGTLYTEISAPLDLNSAGGKTIGEKKGESTCISILGLVAVGDAGLKAAAENGGLTTIRHLDYKFKNVFFGFFTRYTTVAYGE